MLKRLFLVMILALLAIVPVAAIGTADGPATMASHMPAGAQLFVSLRTDDAYLGQLESIVNRVIAQLPAEFDVAPVSLREQLEAGMAQDGVSYDDVRAWLGDYAAVSASGVDQPEPDALVAVQITDRAAALAFLTGPGELVEAGMEGEFTRLESPSDPATIVLLGDEVLLLTNRLELVTYDGPTLADSPDYGDLLAQLPAPSYNILVYVDAAGILAAMPDATEVQAQLGMLGMGNLGSTVVGFTILDDRSMVIDQVQAATDMVPMAAVDPAFARFIPVDSNLVVHATDLTSTVNTVLETLSALAEANDEPDPSMQIQGVVGMLGVDLQEDILSWTTGDYAFFTNIDLDQLITLIGAQSMPESLPLEFGILFEATDEATAQGLVDKLFTVLQSNLPADSEEITLAQDETGLVTISALLPLAPDAPIVLNVYMGVANGAFFIASEQGYAQVISDAPGLDTDPVYLDAARYILPNANGVAYTDEDGLIGTVGILGLGVLGPAIGNVFDNVVEELEQSALPQTRFVQEDPMAQITQALDALRSVLASSSISSTVTDGYAISRAVLTFE